MLVAHLLRRAGQGLIVLFLLLTLLFFTARLTGDPVTFLVGGTATAEEIEQLRDAYGLNDPLPSQYARFLWNTLQLDFGESIRSREPVMPLLMEKALISLRLLLPALCLSVLIAVPLGTIAALNRGSPLDAGAMMLAVLGQSIPSFFLGLILIYVVGVQLE